MKKTNLLIALVALGFFGALSIGENALRESEVRDSDLLVTLKGDVLELSQEQIKAQQNSVIKSIAQDITTNYFVEERFSHATNTIRLSVNSSHIDEIKAIDGVESVEKNTIVAVSGSNSNEIDYEIESMVSQVKAKRQATPTNNASASAMNVPTSGNKGAGILVAVLDDGFYLQHEAFTELGTEVLVKYTKDQIDSMKFTNAKGIADGTSSLYFNSKVPFAYDYGGDNDAIVTAPDTHGTHVAGIVGGNGSYKGIAPDCQIAAMKVFDDTGAGASSADILEALEDCLVLDVDIVSMSFGSPLLELKTSNSIQTCWKTLQAKGVMCNHSAGNEGRDNVSTTPAGNYDLNQTEFGIQNYDVASGYVNSVGSVEPDEFYYETALIVGGGVVNYMDQVTNYTSTDGDVEYAQERFLTDLTNGGEQTEFTYHRVGGLGYVSDFEGLDLTNKIAVIDRGDITFREKIINAVAVGAIGVIIINNDQSATELNFRFDLTNSATGLLYSPSVPVVSVLYRDRAAFGETGDEGTLTILADVIASNPTARTMSSFSSQGYKYDLTILPDIVAPGTNIYSAHNGYGLDGESDTAYNTDTYEYMSGTSMSCPNFSGACAYYLSEFANDAETLSAAKARLIRTFQSTAQIVFTNDSEPTIDSPRRAGAGLADVQSAIATEQYLEGYTLTNEPSGFAKINLLGNTDLEENGLLNFSFLGHNEGDTDVTYGVTVYVLRPRTITFDNDNYADIYEKVVVSPKDDVIAKLSAGEVTLTANGDTVVNITNLQVPQEKLDEIKELFPNGTNLEGYVVLQPLDSSYEGLNIPFAGFYGDYLNAEAVEPFEFEKADNRAYLSDIMNTVGTLFTNYQRPNTDYSSDIVVLNTDSISSLNTSAIATNNANIYSFGTPIGYNAYEETRAKGTPDDPFYVGNNGYANAILIQQTVYKTCADNRITLVDSNGTTVASSAMTDVLFGGTTLQKTCLIYTNSYIENGYFGTRALGGLMFDEVEDGTYTLKFHYDTLAGGEYEKEYTIVVTSGLPEIKSIDNVTVENEAYYRIRFDGEYLMYVVISGSRYEVLKDEEGYYSLVPQSEVSGTKYLYKIYNLAFGINTGISHLDDANVFTIHGDSLNNTYDFTKTITEWEFEEYTRAYEVKIEVTRRGKVVEYNDFNVSFKLWDNWTTNAKEIALYDYDPSTGEWEELSSRDFTVSANGIVSFNSYCGQFRIADLTSEGMPEDSSSEQDTSLPVETSSEEETTSAAEETSVVDETTSLIDETTESSQEEGLSTGAIVGISVGGVGAVAVIATVIFLILKAKK